VSQIVDAHVAYCNAISDLSRDKTELLERIKQLEDRIHRAAWRSSETAQTVMLRVKCFRFWRRRGGRNERKRSS